MRGKNFLKSTTFRIPGLRLIQHWVGVARTSWKIPWCKDAKSCCAPNATFVSIMAYVSLSVDPMLIQKSFFHPLLSDAPFSLQLFTKGILAKLRKVVDCELAGPRMHDLC